MNIQYVNEKYDLIDGQFVERNPKPVKEFVVPDAERCKADAREANGNLWKRVRQCKRRNGHGPEGKYCKQHAKSY